MLSKKIRSAAAVLLGTAVLTLSAAASAQEPATKMGDKDIVATAIEAGAFKTLVAAVTAAGLVETLQGPGPFTVFAPNDAAFAKLPAGTIEALLADKAALTSVLTYHVVPGKVMAADVLKMNGGMVKTVNGKMIKIEVRDGAVYVDGAKVITTDVVATNGVIHVIDAVVLPPK